MEVACARSAESFSASDITQWAWLLSTSYSCDLGEKQRALSTASPSLRHMTHVCQVWQHDPQGMAGKKCDL